MMHPDHDCPDCGIDHFPWSAQKARAPRRERDVPGGLILFAQLEQVIAEFTDLDPDTVRDVLWDLMLHCRLGSDDQGGQP